MDLATTEFYQRYVAESTIQGESAQSAISGYFEIAFKAGGKVLDVGAGSGRDLAVLHQLGFEAYGVEPNESMRSYALGIHPELLGRLQAGTLPQIGNPFATQFDGIVCSAVMMHIPETDLRKSLASMCALLNPGGRLLVSFPHKEDPSALEGERDLDGRYFKNHSSESVMASTAECGLSHIGRWDSIVGQGHDTTLWATLLFELPRALDGHGRSLV
jgi:SAM-dependent methyltransferase